MLWSFVYLAVRNLFALVPLLARSGQSKELEILVLCHELAILRRPAGRPRLTRGDRALLAALSRGLPRRAWTSFPVKPETLLRWHRQLVARRWTYPYRTPGRPPLVQSLRALIVRLARENPPLGVPPDRRRAQGLGLGVSPTSVRKVLIGAGLPPAPERARLSWRAFLRQQAASTLACDFLTVETAFLQRIYVLFLHLAGDTTDRVHRLHLQTRRRLGSSAGAQPDHATAQDRRVRSCRVVIPRGRGH